MNFVGEVSEEGHVQNTREYVAPWIDLRWTGGGWDGEDISHVRWVVIDIQPIPDATPEIASAYLEQVELMLGGARAGHSWRNNWIEVWRIPRDWFYLYRSSTSERYSMSSF